MLEIQFDANSNLSAVFDTYRKAGVFDEAVIIENIAFFALYWYLRKEIGGDHAVEIKDRYLSFRKVAYELEQVLQKNGTIYTREQALIPSPPMDMREDHQLNISRLLVEIFENTPNLGEWFDNELMSRLTSSPKGGRYATPRHLIRFMAGIVGLNSNDTVADFACGTGGMLVANGLVQNATGVEVSPNMARLARANLILHGQTQYDLYLGNALDVASRHSQFIDARFDVVLMNPPFGARIDPDLLPQAFEKTQFSRDFKGSSETMFTALAYEKLKQGGRLAVLVPSGVLFSNNSGEISLRRTLVEQGALQAVISLPRDSMQPVNNLATHVIYAVKPGKVKPGDNAIWFFRPRYDGFTSGRNRKPDPSHDDLPLVESALASTKKSNNFSVSVLQQNAGVIGYYAECGEDDNFHVEKFDQGYEVYVYSAAQQQRFRIAGESIDPLEITTGKRLIGHTVFKSDAVRRGVVFDMQGEIIGVRVLQKSLLDTKSVELQGEKYWVEKSAEFTTRPPAQILGDIKRNQNKLTSSLDRLLSVSEIQQVASAELPPRLQIIAPSQELMQGVQQSIWEIVLTQVEQLENYATPTAFQADDIYSKLSDSGSVIDVQRTLELFERMGLIVSVTYEGVPYYRLLTERDILTEAGK
ncbi:MAG: hypothetical protein MHPDNHAH_02766 [Anaerolineales bacterium]|nr:hypothetical protein [Anaerolineales bacterium]